MHPGERVDGRPVWHTRVFGTAVALFTFSSILCGLAQNAPMLAAARILQGIGAAMMMPVGRLAIVRTFPKSELLMAMESKGPCSNCLRPTFPS